MKRKLALITGGAKGIGRVISEKLALEGWDLVIWGRDQKALFKARGSLESDHSIQVRVQTVNLAEKGVIGPAFSALLKGLEGAFPDALVCNAGDYGTLGRMGELEIESWVRSFDLNFFSVAELVHYYLAESARSPCSFRRKIVLMSGSGLGGSKVWPGISAYGCAKAAIYRLVEIVHEEVHSRGIDINCIAPGAVKTGITQQALGLTPELLGPLHEESMRIQTSGGDSPELAAQTVAQLLRPECDGLSGRLISAKWDGKHLESAQAVHKICRDRDLLRLRRIDDELFGAIRKDPRE